MGGKKSKEVITTEVAPVDPLERREGVWVRR